MTKKSSKSPSGEDRENPSEHLEQQKVEKQDVQNNSSPAKAGKSRQGEQENLKNRGLEEDQPGNPVRSSGSTSESSNEQSAGEPNR